MQSALARLGHVFLALDKNFDLLADFAQTPQNLLVAIHKTKAFVFDPSFGAKFTDQDLQSSQVVSRDSREEMMNSLELEPTMNKVQPSRAIHIHRRSQLSLRKGLARTEVSRRHAPVGECDLDVERHGDNMRYEDKHDAQSPCRDRSPH